VDEESMRLIYSERKMIDVLMTRDKMSRQEAIEFLEFNTFGSGGKINDMPLPLWCRDRVLED
jgi:hypothetical protein